MKYYCMACICTLSIVSAGASALAQQCAYRELGIRHTATFQQIKDHYHKKIRVAHPDKNPDPQATSTTQTLTEHYALLNSKDKKETYRCPYHLLHKIHDSFVELLPANSTSITAILQPIANCFGIVSLDIIDQLHDHMQSAEHKSDL